MSTLRDAHLLKPTMTGSTVLCAPITKPFPGGAVAARRWPGPAVVGPPSTKVQG